MSDDDSTQPKYQIVCTRFNDGDEVRLPHGLEILHTERLDECLEVWYRTHVASGTRETDGDGVSQLGE